MQDIKLNAKWNCQYCNQFTILRDDDIFITNDKHQFPSQVLFEIQTKLVMIKCHNPECEKLTVQLRLHRTQRETLFENQIIPQNTAKIYPSYIPKPLIEDYTEACAVKFLSPKSSATLARRCL